MKRLLAAMLVRLDPRLCARWWSRIWRLRARHDTLSVADPAGAGSKPDSSSTRITLAGTHDQWATVTARIPRPDRNRGMTPSCSVPDRNTAPIQVPVMQTHAPQQKGLEEPVGRLSPLVSC